MTDAASGSAMLAGNPAGDNAAGNGGAAGGATNQTTTDNQGGASNTPAAGTGNWWDNIEDADLKGYVQNKAWKDTTELANGYRNLEKLLGSEKIPMPKGDTDAEGWSRVYDALGRPKSAEDYNLPVPEGDPGDFAKAAAGKFHELGISAKQASALAEWWNSTAAGQREQMMQQSAQATQQDLAALQREWGQAFDENVQLAKQATREFGLSREVLDKMENGMGTKAMMEFLAKVGRGFTEHNFEGGRSTNSFGMTPEAAQQRLKDLRNDKEWSAKYLQGNADAKAEMSRLMALAHPDG